MTLRQYINQVRYQNKVRTMFGIDGDNPIPTLQECIPVVAVEDERFENRFPGNEFSFCGSETVAAGGAGNTSNVAILNPTGSGILAVIEQIDQSVAGYVAAVAESVILANYTPVTKLITRDFRGFGSACTLWSRNNAAGPTERCRIHQVGIFPFEVAIAPGQSLVMVGVTSNALYEAGFTWRERGLDLSTK